MNLEQIDLGYNQLKALDEFNVSEVSIQLNDLHAVNLQGNKLRALNLRESRTKFLNLEILNVGEDRGENLIGNKTRKKHSYYL